MTDATLITQPERASIDRYLPQSVKDLAWMANEVAKSGLYKNGRVPMSGSEVFVVFMKGAELGLTPMQSMNEISLIKGKPFVSKDVLTARIIRSPRCTHWDPSDCDDKHARILFGVRGDDVEKRELTTLIDDIPKRYFASSASGEPSNWTLIPEDMLFAWVVRRIARRWFPEALLDIGEGPSEPIDESKVIDVAKVERVVEQQGPFHLPHMSKTESGLQCFGDSYLHASRNGGAFVACAVCGATASPPQEVRDLIRGTPEALTIAGAAEPVLEPGERVPTHEELREYVADHNIAWPGVPDEPVDAAAKGVTVDEPAGVLDALIPTQVTPNTEAKGAEQTAMGAVQGSADPEPAPALPSEAEAIEHARAVNHLETWRENARTAITLFVRGHRDAATDEEKAHIRETMTANGWDGAMGITSYLRGCDDVELSRMLDTFELFVSPITPTEA